MTWHGTLLKDGLAVLDAVPVTLDTYPESAPWSGWLVLPPGRFLAAGLYVLRLDDGRSGDVLLASRATGPSPERVPFRGSGILD